MKLQGCRSKSNISYLLKNPETLLKDSSINLKQVAGFEGTITEVLTKAAKVLGGKYIVVSLNETIKLTERLMARVEAEVARKFSNDWVVMYSRAVTSGGEIKSCVYSQKTPSLPRMGFDSDIVNASYDFMILNVDLLKPILKSIPSWINESFNSVLINESRYQGRLALYNGRLICSCESYFEANEYVALNEIRKAKGLVNIKGYMTELGEYIEVFPEIDFSPVVGVYSEPSFSIIVRTTFERPELLKRALASIYFSKCMSNAKIEVLLVSQSYEIYPRELDKVKDLLNIKKIRVDKGGEIPGRTINLIQGIKAAKNDYLFVLDDDDYVEQGFFDVLVKKISCSLPGVVFFDSKVIKEDLIYKNNGAIEVKSEKIVAHYLAKNALKLFGGANQIPVCGFAVQKEIARQFISEEVLRHDLSEDYIYLMGVLSLLPSMLILNKNLVNISIRDNGGNTVTAIDRSQWLRDISDHLDSVFSGDASVGQRLQFLSRLLDNKSGDMDGVYEIAYKKILKVML